VKTVLSVFGLFVKVFFLKIENKSENENDLTNKADILWVSLVE
jgi:hypothetical protein